MNFHGSLLQKLISASLCIIFCALGWWLIQSGFNQVKKLQEIERLPVSQVASSLSGEAKLSLTVDADQKFLRSDYFKKPSVYYSYRYEEEERDSEGNTYWDTKYTRSNHKDFFASDSSGKVQINAQSQMNETIHFSLPISQQLTQGKSRHTEWRIEAGNKLFVMGYFQDKHLQDKPKIDSIGFVKAGAYLPLISRYSESHEKSSLGLEVILKISGGVALLALAALCLTLTLGVHRILAFLFFLTFSALVPLSHLGVSMLYQDIVAAHINIQAKEHAVKQKLTELTGSSTFQDLDWHQLFNQEKLTSIRTQQVNGIITDFAFIKQRYQQQLGDFPNNFIAWLYNIDSKSMLEVLPDDLKRQVMVKLKSFKITQTDSLLANIVSLIGLLICVSLTWWGFKLIRLKRHIENLPTSKSSGLVFGLAELKGRAKSILSDTLKGPLTDASCFWYHYLVQEKRGSGKNTKWVTITNHIEVCDFACQDQSGSVTIIPDNAEVITHHKATESRGNRRYTEKTIRPNDKLYLIGEARVDRKVGDKLEVGYQKDSPFLISNLSETQVMYRKANAGMLCLTAAFSVLMFSTLFYLGSIGSFLPADYLLAALIAPVYMGFVVLVLHYNDLVYLKQRAARNFANIDVSLQKRVDLIPNLEKIVKQFMQHEQELLAQITKLRSAFNAGFDNNQQIDKAIEVEQTLLLRITALAENYPELKSSSTSIQLMNKLIDLENEVALMREGYNDAVEYYNTRISSFPDIFFARLFGFTGLDLLRFEAKKFDPISFE